MADPNQSDPENLQDPDRYTGGRPLTVGRSNPDSDKGDTYDPSTVVVNRAREQGLGVGQKDIDYQRDATEARSAEQYSLASDSQLEQDRKGEAERKSSPEQSSAPRG